MSSNPAATPAPRPDFEVWLRTNVRALLVGFVVTSGLLLSGISAILIADRFSWGIALQVLGWLTIALCSYASLMLLYQMRLPRLAYQAGELYVYLKSSQPVRVPIEIVELFFAGQGESMAPATGTGPTKSRTVVVRLAEAATDWHNLPIRTAQGEWREAYIILRGTWCEPLTPEVFKSLNRRLSEVHRERRARLETPA